MAPSGLVPAALRSVKGKRAAARSMVGDIQEHEDGAIQEHENERAEVVIVCEPEGTSLMMGGLHPRCALLPLCHRHGSFLGAFLTAGGSKGYSVFFQAGALHGGEPFTSCTAVRADMHARRRPAEEDDDKPFHMRLCAQGEPV